MDIFSTVSSAIDLAEKVWKLIDNHRRAPERLRRLQSDVRSLQSILERLKTTELPTMDQRVGLQAEVWEIETILNKLLHTISRTKSKSGESVLTRAVRSLRIQASFDDLNELIGELQKRKTTLSLAVNTVSLGMIANIDANVQSRTAQLSSGMTQPAVHHTSPWTAREFLDTLNAPNYVDDQYRIKEASEGTVSWIYHAMEYKEWRETPKLSSLHVVGKMGSGKSVLMKSVIKKLRTQILKPKRHESAVLYYFCTCVNRTDTPINILKGLIAQLVNDCDGLFEDSVGDIEVLQVKPSVESFSWSFEALWHILTDLIQHARFSSLYCVIDALDECEPNRLDELLQRLLGLGKDPLFHDTKMRLLFSSREQTHILAALESGDVCFRLFIRPDIIAPDIRVAMQDDLVKLKNALHLEEEETERLQEVLLKKSDGMFLWVSLAMKEIMTNRYNATYEDLEELVEDLPVGLKGLYEKSWLKLLELLPTNQISLAKQVLIWLLLAKRALTVAELTLALAVKPGEKNVPLSKKLLRSLDAFVLKYLTPFVEVSGMDTAQKPPSTTDESKPKGFEPVGAKIRLVHQSAQEYLLSVCKGSHDNQAASHLEVDLRDGHEAIARVCISYLQCEEIQLGWIGLENRDKRGRQIMTEDIKEEVRKRLETHILLEYASNNWAYHVRQCQFLPPPERNGKCEGSKKDDIFQHAIRLVKDYRPGYECAYQVRQLMRGWDREQYYGPGPALSVMVAANLSVPVRRLLDDPDTDLHIRDSEGDLPLHFVAAAETATTHPEEQYEIMEMLLEKGEDINCLNIIGNTPLHLATKISPPEMVRILLEKGAATDIKNMRGETPLNQEGALSSQKIVNLLIQAGADAEMPDDKGFSPIVKAADFYIWETVRLLLEHGVDPKSSSAEGQTCLHIAAAQGEISIIELLLQCKVPVDIRNRGGYTPLHSAADNDQYEAVRLLVSQGANTAAASDNGTLPVHFAAEFASPRLFGFLLEYETDINIVADKYTLLGWAARGKSSENVSLLLARNPNIHSRCGGNASVTPLQIAAFWGHLESVRLLLDHGADVNSLSSNGASALAYASDTGNLEIVQLLLERGALVDGSSNMEDFGPLHYAAFHGKIDVVDCLLQHGALIERPGPGGYTPLMRSVEGGHLGTAKLLLSHGAQINASGYEADYSVLGLACCFGHTEIVKWLIENGADINALDRNGETALFDCVTSERLDILEELLERGAPINSQNTLGNTPLTVALWAGKTAVAKFLLDHGADPILPQGPAISGILAAAYTGNTDVLRQLHENMGSRLREHFNHNTLVEIVAMKGHLDALRYLLSVSCWPTVPIIRHPSVLTDIILAAEGGTMLRVLHDTGNLDVNIGRSQVGTVLHELCKLSIGENSLESLIVQLVDCGLDLNARDEQGASALQIAVFECNILATRALVSHEADLKNRDDMGNDVFDLAIERFNSMIRGNGTTTPSRSPLSSPTSAFSLSASQSPLELSVPPPILAPDAPGNPREASTDNSLQNALLSDTSDSGDGILQSTPEDPVRSQEEIIKILAKGPDGNILTNDQGQTLLHVAAVNGCMEVIDLLLEVCRAAALVCDNSGWTPGMVAERNGRHDVADRLNRVDDITAVVPDLSKVSSPTAWSTEHKATSIILSDEGCVASMPEIDCGYHVELNDDGRETRSVQVAYSIMANAAVPYHAKEYYYEIEFLEDPSGTRGVAIGFGCLPHNLNDLLPGWSRIRRGVPSKSWGYHADNGRFYAFSEKRPGGWEYAEPWGPGDVIGCGFNAIQNTVYYVRNGVYLGVACTGIQGQLFPMVGLAGGGMKIRAKFGIEPPYSREEITTN